MVAVRNALMHGNYEQAAAKAGLPTKDDYFRSSQYIKDVNILFKIANRTLFLVDRAGRVRYINHRWGEGSQTKYRRRVQNVLRGR